MFALSRMEAVSVSPCVYVLKCEDDCWYVGITHNLNFRLGQHFGGSGSKWTKLHKPLELVEVIYPGTREMEDSKTKALVAEFGDKVRGGSWCKV